MVPVAHLRGANFASYFAASTFALRSHSALPFTSRTPVMLIILLSGDSTSHTSSYPSVGAALLQQ